MFSCFGPGDDYLTNSEGRTEGNIFRYIWLKDKHFINYLQKNDKIFIFIFILFLFLFLFDFQINFFFYCDIN